MNRYIQQIVFSNPKYYQYMRDNPEWYRILSRTPEKIQDFKTDVSFYHIEKKANQIRPILQLLSLLEKKA